MYGFRGWHEGDVSRVDAEDLESMVLGAKQYEAEMRKATSG